MSKPTIHLICGLPCSGKSRYSRELNATVKGVVFHLDRWLISLYGHYDIADTGHARHVQRVMACRSVILDTAMQLIERGVDVILDDGFFFMKHRLEYVAVARERNAACDLHYLKATNEELEKRIVARNMRLPEYNFTIDPSLLNDFKRIFEPPDASEGYGGFHAIET